MGLGFNSNEVYTLVGLWMQHQTGALLRITWQTLKLYLDRWRRREILQGGRGLWETPTFYPSLDCGGLKSRQRGGGAKGGVEGRKRWCFKYTQLPVEDTTSDILVIWLLNIIILILMNNAGSGVQPEGLGGNTLTLTSVSSQAHINQTSIPHMVENNKQHRWSKHQQKSDSACNRCDLICFHSGPHPSLWQHPLLTRTDKGLPINFSALKRVNWLINMEKCSLLRVEWIETVTLQCGSWQFFKYQTRAVIVQGSSSVSAFKLFLPSWVRVYLLWLLLMDESDCVSHRYTQT